MFLKRAEHNPYIINILRYEYLKSKRKFRESIEKFTFFKNPLKSIFNYL